MVGIYKITNKINNKVYIGKSKNISRRWHEHIKSWELGLHHSYKLQEDWNKYGVVNFTFEVIEICKKEDLNILEEKHIFENDSLFSGYNVRNEGQLVNPKNMNSKSSKYLIDIDEIFKLTNEYSIVTRFIAAHINIIGINGNVNSRAIENKKDLINILNLSEREFYRSFKHMLDCGLIISDNSEMGFYFNENCIKKVYAIRENDMDLSIIYKKSFLDIYNKTKVTEHKTIGQILKLHQLFNNETMSSSLQDIRNTILESNMSNKSNCSKKIKEFINFGGNILSANEESKVFLSTDLYQPCRSLKNI